MKIKKINCQICGKKVDVLLSLSFGIWNHLCQGCYDRELFRKQNKNSSSKIEKEDNSHSELKFKKHTIERGYNNVRKNNIN